MKTIVRIFLIIIVATGNSFATHRHPIELFYNSDARVDFTMLLNHLDSTFVYFNTSKLLCYGVIEVGGFNESKTNLLISPKFQIQRGDSFNKCAKHNKEQSFYFSVTSDGQTIDKSISYRIYSRKRNRIQDESLDYYFKNDSNAFSCYLENIPLYAEKIKKHAMRRPYSKVCEVYLSENDDKELLVLNHIDSTFVFCKSDKANQMQYEFGYEKMNGDTLILETKCFADNDTCMYYVKGDTACNFFPERRVFLKDEKQNLRMILPLTKDDENENLMHFLKKIYIRQSKVEKEIFKEKARWE